MGINISTSGVQSKTQQVFPPRKNAKCVAERIRERTAKARRKNEATPKVHELKTSAFR